MRAELALITLLVVGGAAWAAEPEAPRAELERRIDAFVEARMDEDSIPGAAIAVLRRGEVLAIATYGSANLELDVPVTRHSVFELASLTKSFTAAAIVLLAHENALDLDDPLARWVPDAPEGWKAITLRRLLCHRAGLAHRFERTVDGVLLMDYDTAEMLRSAKATPMLSEPGTDWEYSDQGYFLLGVVLERVTGTSYAEFLRERFFDPLGMDETFVQDQARILPGRVAGYTVRDGTLRNLRRDWQFGLTSHFGVLSSIADLVRWERALVRRTVLPEAVVQELWTPAAVFRRDADGNATLGYGFGWWVERKNGRTVVEHSGITGTSYYRDLDRGLTVIVLTNRDQGSGRGSIEIAHAIARIVEGHGKTE